MNSIEKIIKSIEKFKWKILSQNRFNDIIYEIEWKDIQQNRIYKLTHQLKNREIIKSIKKDLYFIIDPNKKHSNDFIEELYYRKILKDHCNNSTKQRYIWWITAFEYHLFWNGITIPDCISIITKEKQSLETVMFEKKVFFKKYENKKNNTFPFLIKNTIAVNIQWKWIFKIANLELSILECLYNFDTANKWYIEENIKKIIKKNWKTLNIKNIEDIIKQGKHNSSLNKLYNITKNQYPQLSESIKLLIKKYWFIL